MRLMHTSSVKEAGNTFNLHFPFRNPLEIKNTKSQRLRAHHNMWEQLFIAKAGEFNDLRKDQ